MLDLLFPIACVGCGKYDEGGGQQAPHSAHGASRGRTGSTDDGERWLCAACRERIEPDVPRCLVCREHSPTGRTCYPCLPKTPLTGTIAVGWYHDPILRAAIAALKFRGVRALADPLGELLARRLMGHGPQAMGHGETALVSLPLHPRRERARGFNQARLLAKAIGEQLNLPVHNVLVRTRPTAPQTSLIGSTEVRRQNVARAFALSSSSTPLPVQQEGHPQFPSRIILVDDVLTSGATLEAAAAVLADAGAKEIWAAVVARG
ncbi:MAG: phosphoribosyltransferase family protein [bacterium]|nr:phosphoribosyltransferase family protein [bacterium]